MTAPYALPDLPYDYGALEPHISGEIMELHHSKHHAKYVAGANSALEQMAEARDAGEFAGVNLLQRNLACNLSGHVNHTLFWEIMTPGGASEPSGELATAIQTAFGGVDQLKAAVNDAGAKRFGSGWAWVVTDASGTLSVLSTANQDSPLMEGKVPVLGVDVWEHAYYLKYQNKRPDYLSAWWNTLNWDKVAENYAKAKSGG